MDPMQYRLLALKHALKLEILGMKRSRGPSAYTIIKREFGFRGNKRKVLDQFKVHINKEMVELTNDVAN